MRGLFKVGEWNVTDREKPRVISTKIRLRAIRGVGYLVKQIDIVAGFQLLEPDVGAGWKN